MVSLFLTKGARVTGFFSVDVKFQTDMGRVIGAATKELAGKTDGKDFSAKVKQILNS